MNRTNVAKKNSRQKKASLSNSLITVVTIVHNDHDLLEAYLLKLQKTLKAITKFYEIILIDNGSTDQSIALLKRLQLHLPNIRVLVLSHRYDGEAAVSAALENSIGEYVIVLSIERDPVSLIPQLLKTAQKGYDVITLRASNMDGVELLVRYLSSLKAVVMKWMFGRAPLPSLRRVNLFSRSAVTSITKIHKHHSLQQYRVSLSGLPHIELSFKRKASESSVLQTKVIQNVLFSLVSSVSRPVALLRITIVLSVAAILGNVYLLLHIYSQLVFGDQTNLAIYSLSFSNAVMFSIVFLVICLLSMYLEKERIQSGSGSQYTILEELNSSLITESKITNVV